MTRIPPNATLRVTDFVPSFSDDELARLHRQLVAARDNVPRETYASRQPQYGTQHAWLKDSLEYWHDSFDWRKYEQSINSVQHYKADIEQGGSTFTIEFIAHFSTDPNAIPLMLCHGWPGSALEFVHVVKILSESTSPAFHVIAANQPGYLWSSPPPLDRKFGLDDCAEILHKLMIGLGFTRGYAVQGGDIGSVLARMMACKYKECLAVNFNYLPLLPPPAVEGSDEDPATRGLTELEIKNARKALEFARTGRAYASLQGTRPATAGLIMQSSPLALLAWLGEKFHEWTDESPTLDDLLGTVTAWYILETYPTSIWPYAEIPTGVGTIHRDPTLYVHKPMGFSSFACEISSAPRAWAAQTGNLQFYKYHERGGHFAASERPQEFAQDMVNCFSQIWPGFLDE
ncbi:hypothetical protein OIV83_000902 [Microbotryomycetes sp. JL201]|nr:hypothetical protein OIV83_000902 [Microbotryomycetes sp. JL201]